MDLARPARIDALSGLRFAAAAGILLFHVGAPIVEGAPRWVERVRVGGHVWVGLFYVLSGFVLAHAHPAPLDAAGRRAFLVARLARLYPAYLLAFLLYAPFALEYWRGGGTAAMVKAGVVALACLLLLQAWFPPIARLWNAPGWSTSVVASFYVAFPHLLVRLSARTRAGLWRAAALAWAAALALPLLYLAAAPDGPSPELLPREPRLLEALKFHPLARGAEFVAGMALGLLVRRHRISLGRAGGVAAVAALLVAVVVLAWDRAPYVLLHNGLLLPLWAVALVGLAGAPGGALARLLGSPAGRALGDSSFALYALQEPLWRWARTLAGGDPPGTGFALTFCAVAIALSYAVSRTLERPARRWLRRILDPAPAGAIPPGRRGAMAAAPSKRGALGGG